MMTWLVTVRVLTNQTGYVGGGIRWQLRTGIEDAV